MKIYLKSTIFLFLAALLLISFRAYYRLEDIDKIFKQNAFQNSQILANITQSHLINFTKLKSQQDFNYIQDLTKNFVNTYSRNNSKYMTKIIDIDIKNIDKYSSFVQDGYNFLNKNLDKESFFTQLQDGHYFFAQKFLNYKNSKNQLFFIAEIDTSKEKKKQENKFILTLIEMIILILVVFGIVYKLFRDSYMKEKKFLSLLKHEIKIKTADIEKKNSEIIHRFFYDDLTNLPNRNSLLKKINKNDNIPKGMILINLDNFKEINDFYGFDIGDEVLTSFGNFLKLHALRYSFETYKLHADEFALLALNPDEKIIKKCIDELLLDIKNLSIMTEDDYDIEVQVTIGVSLHNDNLFGSTDMALKKAKAEQLSSLFFDTSLEIESQYRYNLEWTKKIKQAIKNDKIIAYCQPIVNLENKNIAKFEVLARMQDKDDKIISPFAFLEVAKKNKLYPSITKSIIKQALNTFKNTNHSFAINLSILDILDKSTVDFIIDNIKEYPNPENITFEILESEGIENFQQVSEFIKRLKQYNCKLAIDDFGSGYSNFEYILNLKVDLLKIDASLIKNIDKSPNARSIVETIVSFANKLNLETCAEFVHSKEVYKKLLEIKTTYIQGYYISEPFLITQAKDYKPNKNDLF